MFDVTWGEMFVISAVGLYFIGKKDLPKASRVAGMGIGRLVGMVQGIRTRADTYTSQTQLKQIQQELQRSLREIEYVKSELASSMNPTRPMIGRNIGSPQSQSPSQAHHFSPLSTPPPAATAAQPYVSQSALSSQLPPASETAATISVPAMASTMKQSIAAIAEDEWARHGMGFVSRAERQQQSTGLSQGQQQQNTSTMMQQQVPGSLLLSDIIKQSLISDQHHRIYSEQQSALISSANIPTSTKQEPSK